MLVPFCPMRRCGFGGRTGVRSLVIAARLLGLLGAILLAVALSASPGHAGKNAGGALIVHTQDAYVFSASTACTTTYSIPASCEEANTRSDKNVGTVVWLLAAFPDTSSPGVSGIYFGIDYDDVNLDPGAATKLCGPAGSMELPDSGWPYEGRGNTVAFGTPVVGNRLFPVYVFKIDGGTDSSYFSTAVNPTGGYAAFIDDSAPPATDEVTKFGTVRWYKAGENDCPAPGGDSQDGGAEEEGGWADQSQGESSEGGLADWPDRREDLTFIEMATTKTDFPVVARQLEAKYGLRILVGMSPDGLICRASPDQRDAASADPRVSLVTNESIPDLPDPATAGLAPGDAGVSSHVWNSMLAEAPTRWDLAKSDSLESFMDLRDETSEPPADSAAQTSIYLLGDVGVSLIFVESDSSGPCVNRHSPEDWTLRRMNRVHDEMVAGLTRLANMATPSHTTFWLVDTHNGVPTSVEPIHQGTGYDLWCNEVLDTLGFSQGNVFQRARAYCNWKRSQAATPYDWWFMTFAIADSCDWVKDDGHFPDGFVSYASHYGPRVVLLEYNGKGGIQYALDWVALHETCHLFGAPDEWRVDYHDCDERWGYLRVPNGNRLGCVDSLAALPCAMRQNLEWDLCDFTRAHLGWRDMDEPPDYVYDPIDHHDSHMSMLIGEADSLSPGDWADIYGPQGDWVKRLVASEKGVDRGRVLWDGINYAGLPCSTGSYSWLRRGKGSPHAGFLSPDSLEPEIIDLTVRYGLGGVDDDDILSFRFVDPDTHAGRVRAEASLWVPDTLGARETHVPIFRDEVLMERDSLSSPIERPFRLTNGLWTVTVQVWNVGSVPEAKGQLMNVSSGVDSRPVYPLSLTLSHGRPNPSGDWVSWDLRVASAAVFHLSVVGVDGRRIRSWSSGSLPAGITRVLWDGRNDRGERVASGKYFLMVTDHSGKRTSASAIIVR